MSATERRRPAPAHHPLAAVPAATCARQLPRLPLGKGPASDVVHVLVGGAPLCWLRVRNVQPWTGFPPLRLCSLCSQGLTGDTLGRFWKPTRAELAEMHLYAADQLVTATRERLANIRSAAIYDGSALLPVDHLPTYRQSRGIPADQEPAPLHAAVILGQLLDRVAPQKLVVPAAEEAEQLARDVVATATRQRTIERASVATSERVLDLQAARKGRRR